MPVISCSSAYALLRVYEAGTACRGPLRSASSSASTEGLLPLNVPHKQVCNSWQMAARSVLHTERLSSAVGDVLLRTCVHAGIHQRVWGGAALSFVLGFHTEGLLPVDVPHGQVCNSWQMAPWCVLHTDHVMLIAVAVLMCG